MCFRKKQVLSKRYQNLLAPHLILHSMMLELGTCQVHFAFTNLLPGRLYQSGSTKEDKFCGGKKHWIYLLCSYAFQCHLNKDPTQSHIISVGAELNVQSIVLVISGTSRTLHIRSLIKQNNRHWWTLFLSALSSWSYLWGWSPLRPWCCGMSRYKVTIIKGRCMVSGFLPLIFLRNHF